MLQLTVAKIVDYGPWTLTQGPDREHRLQMLQASLYREIQRLFSDLDCLVFPNRADEFFAVTNGLGAGEHAQIQASLAESFDVGLSMSVGYAKTPLDANHAAHAGRTSGMMLDGSRDVSGSVYGGPDGAVTIAHLDVENLTGTRQTRSPYEISSMIFDLYSRMSRFFLENRSLAFFMGGDNFMVVLDPDAKDSVRRFLDTVRPDGITLNCGIGTGATARGAARLATESLDTIRRIRDSGREKPEIYELPCC